MPHCFYLLLLLFGGLYCSAQVKVDKPRFEIVTGITQNTDSLIILKLHSYYGGHLNDGIDCSWVTNRVLVWLRHNKVYFQKICDCYDDWRENILTTWTTPVVLHNNSNVFDIPTHFFDSLKAEQLRPFIVKNVKGTVENYEAIKTWASRNTYVSIIWGSSSLEKVINDYSFKRTMDGLVNLNYDYNRQTITNQFLVAVYKAIEEIEKNHLFIH